MFVPPGEHAKAAFDRVARDRVAHCLGNGQADAHVRPHVAVGALTCGAHAVMQHDVVA